MYSILWEVQWILPIGMALVTECFVNPFMARFSDGHATLCRKRIYQINYFSYAHKTTYLNVPNKLRNNNPIRFGKLQTTTS